jgi:hypothetical protein
LLLNRVEFRHAKVLVKVVETTYFGIAWENRQTPPGRRPLRRHKGVRDQSVASEQTKMLRNLLTRIRTSIIVNEGQLVVVALSELLTGGVRVGQAAANLSNPDVEVGIKVPCRKPRSACQTIRSFTS